MRIWIYNERDTAAIGPGTYHEVIPGNGGPVDPLFALFYWGNGEAGGSEGATVTLDEVSSTVVRGFIDVSLTRQGQDVGHLAGMFDAPLCR